MLVGADIFFFQAEDGIRDSVASCGLGDVFKRQALDRQIADMSPRSIKLSMEIAFARAVMAQRDHLNAEDWPALRMDGSTQHRRAAMGFTSS